MRPLVLQNRKLGYNYPQQGYLYQYPSPAHANSKNIDYLTQGYQHLCQGYVNQSVYHCPTCGTPVYMVYITTPQSNPKGLTALLIAVLALLAIDILFLR